MAFCKKCGTQFEAGIAFCGNCGSSIAAAATLGMKSPAIQHLDCEAAAPVAPAKSTIAVMCEAGKASIKPALIRAAICVVPIIVVVIFFIIYHKIDFHHAATAPIITTTSPAPTDAAKPSQAGSSDSALSSDSASSNVVSIFPTAVDGFADAASKAAEDADFAKSAASNVNYVTRVLNSLSPQDRKIVEIVRNGHQAGNTESIGKALEKAFSSPLSWKVSQAGNVTIVEFDGSMIFGELAQIDLSGSSNAQVHLAEIQMQACQNERGCKSLLTSIFDYCDAPERNFPDEVSKGTCAQKQVDLIRLQPIPISVKFTVNRADSSFKYASNNWNLTTSELSKLIY
jgi:hypothetical protein